jgi:hypothetical protein
MSRRGGQFGFRGHPPRLSAAALLVALAMASAGCSNSGQQATAASSSSAAPTVVKPPAPTPMGDRTTSRYDGKVCDLLDHRLLWSAVAGPMQSDLSPVRVSDGPRAAWFAEAVVTCYIPLQDGSGVQLVANVLTTDGKRSMIADELKYGAMRLSTLGDDAIFRDHNFTAFAGNRMLSILLFDTNMTAEQEESLAAAILTSAIQRLPS